jgi:hypothetical protein
MLRGLTQAVLAAAGGKNLEVSNDPIDAMSSLVPPSP